MRPRKKTSGGQAILMATLSLMAMAGLIGLAVDLGWSFFVQQEAHVAADGAAMGAVQEAYSRLNGDFGNITCGSGSAAVNCQPTAVACSAVTETSNLYNGCLYASVNGFTGAAGLRQQVTIQANTGSIALPPGTTGLDARNVPYWVRVVAVQTIPQLFSVLLGHTSATVAASAVAGITGNAVPGSLVLLDQPNDCFAGGGGFFGGGGTMCGVDLNMSCFLCSLRASGPIYLASTCNGTSQTGCGSSVGSGGSNYAGNSGGNSVNGSAIQVQNPGKVTGGNWNPTVQQEVVSSIFLDPTTGEAQPPLTATAPVATCGVLNGQIGTGSNLTVGPYSYYAYSTLNKSGLPIPTGNPIRVNGNVTFSGSSANCPGILNANGATAQGASFPTYFFYGGMVLDNLFNFNASFGPGQYVMVGTNNSAGGNCANSVFCVNNNVGILTGDSTSGTMFIFTSPQSIIGSPAYPYPGTNIPGSLYTQININASVRPEITTLAGPGGLVNNEGNVNVEALASLTTLTGVVQGGAAPATLNQYNGIAFWQDRANSTVEYDATGHVQLDSSGNVIPNPTQPPPGANGMSIAGFIAGVIVNGVIYQPRGAYITDFGIFSGVDVALQIITGGVSLSGIFTSITLGTPTHPLTSYTTSLIQ